MTPEELGLVKCGGCGKMVDPDVCGCGDYLKDHKPFAYNHQGIPQGCDCYRYKGDK